MAKRKSKEPPAEVVVDGVDITQVPGTDIIPRDSQTPAPRPGQPGNPGKPVGALRKKTLEALAAVEKIRASGTTPLEAMWEIAQTDFTNMELPKRDNLLAKFRMLSEIAPYVHPKLTAVAIKTDGELTKKTHEALLLELDHPPQATEEDLARLDESMEVFPATPYNEDLE